MKTLKLATKNTYDVLTNKLVRSVFPRIKNMVAQDQYGYFDVGLDQSKNGINLNKVRIVFQEVVDPQTFATRDYHVGGGFSWDKKDRSQASIIIVISVNKNRKGPFKESFLQNLHQEISNSIRHELEHFRQYHMGDIGEDPSGTGVLNTPEKARKYFFHRDEVNAYLREALYRTRKNKGTTLTENIMNIIDAEFGHQKGGSITEEGKQWLQLYRDIQSFYFNEARKQFTFLSPEVFGDTTIRNLI